MKITLENFQSISEGELEFPVGITAIVGESNSGKTAIVRAVTSLLSNPSEGKDFIQHGTDSTTVVLDIEGTQIEWGRTKKESHYRINGELHQKVGNTDSFELSESNGFCLGDDGEILNIQDEWQPLFPFGRTDSALYRLFEDVFSISNSSEVLAKVKSDESKLKSDIKTIEEDCIRKNNKLTKLSEFLDDNKLSELIEGKKQIVDTFENLEGLNTDCDKVNRGLHIYSKIKDIEPLDIETSMIEDYIGLSSDCDFVGNNINLIETNTDTIQIDEQVLVDYFSLDKDCSELHSLLTELSGIKKDIFSTREKIQEIDNELSEVKTCPLCGNELGDSHGHS